MDRRWLPYRQSSITAYTEDDLDFITGLALWNGDCLPNPRAMMDLRLKLPGLVHAQDHTRFGYPRGFTTANTMISAAIIEPFLQGQAVRVVIIGDHHWQIKLRGDSWLKSIHHADADFMDVDPDLLDDTRTIQKAFGMEIIANDYIVGDNGEKYLLEVNHIPNVTRFTALWDAYLEFVINWVNARVPTP